MDKHAVSIKWSDEDSGFIATIPGIQGLSAFGKTREEALSELDIASEAYFESLKKAGRQLPDEEKVIPYSGQIRLRMPKSLHADLSDKAKDEGVSLNTYIVTLLSEKHTGRYLLKEVADLKRNIEIIYSQIMSDTYNASHSLHKIEESVDTYQAKKNKKK
ncbi:MAG: toxin-antitoxin system HicB family antitoxin [Candidatus Aminicenantes bacterium]|nr:toxin-antitoxin system HicB family antitoxin [Candidatus Aminicenantes bacterium]MDH5743275.1 toxin-antitoxin system HicB family antitoxin [Candidatus Aminicenantes bacterium]